MRQAAIDTNAFLRLLLDDIPSQAKEVEKILEQAKKLNIKLHVAQIVIFELNFILDKYYHFPKNEIINKLKSVVQTPYLDIQDREVFIVSLKVFADNNISLADSFILAKSKIENWELFTFDRNLQKYLLRHHR